MINENLGKLVQSARDKKPTNFKEILTSEIDSRINAKVTEIRDGLSKSMFKENCEGHPDGEEHTHEDGTVHTHEGGDVEHSHEDEEVTEKTIYPGSNYDKKKDGRNAARKAKKDAKKKDDQDEGTLPPALQKAIDAKKKDKGDDDEDEDDSPVGKKDENIANFGDKKAKAFTDDDNPTDNKKKKDKKEDIRTVSRRILDKSK
jgi:hypothetical protein